MAEPRKSAREIFGSLAGAVVFAIGLGAYLLHGMAPSEPERPLLVPAAREVKEAPLISAENRLMKRFALALDAQRWEDAYALMAPAYRESQPLDAFRAQCSGSPFLAGIKAAAVLHTRTMRLSGATSEPYTVLGRGIVEGKAGMIDAAFTFQVAGGKYSLLVLELGGIPVLDGASGR